MLTPEVIAELRKLEASATPGPWFYDEFVHEETPYSKRRVYRVEIKGDPRCRDCSPWREGLKRWSSRLVAQIVDFCDWSDHPSNRDLIIALRNNAPALLSAAEALSELRRDIDIATLAMPVTAETDYEDKLDWLCGQVSIAVEEAQRLQSRVDEEKDLRTENANLLQANRMANDLMAQRESQVAELQQQLMDAREAIGRSLMECDQRRLADSEMWQAQIAALQADKVRLETALPLSDWHEDYGPVLWHLMPISEPPYCGTPLDSDWPYDDDAEELHWTPLPDANGIQERFETAKFDAARASPEKAK